jgi:hypothetical protein
MTTQSYLKPAAGGIRKPTDPAQENGQIINPPRYAEFGGLTSASKIAGHNPLTISKPNGGRK